MSLGGTYTTGTFTVVSGETTASFSGTLLESVAEQGDWILCDGVVGYIDSVDSDTAVTFEQAWAGDSQTDAAYVLIKMSWLRYDPAITQAKVRDLIALLHAQGSFLFVTGSEPDPAMGEDGQYALKTNGGPWQLWYKTGGVWEAQGIPVGTTFRGEWNSATEYFANDQVGHNGSTWGAIAGSTNVEPGTDDEVWSLSAHAGADGQHGGAVSFTQVFSTSTSNADPGDGMLRLNNATQSSATVIRTDYLDKDGNSLTDLIGSLTTSTSTVKGQIRLAEVGDPTRWIIFDLTAKSDMTGYFNLTVAHVAHSTNVLRDGEEIGFYFTPKGDVGQQGIQGNQGYAPVLAVVSDGDRRVFQVTDWTGSTGTKPATGKYVGTSGLVDAIGDAIDVRGTQGIQGEQGLGIQPDASGPLADRDTYDDEAAGFVFVDTDATPFDLYIKLSATTADWSAASPIGGAGDMLASVYDPNAVEGDAFDLDNMSPAPGATGKLLFTATNEADALDTLGATTVGVDVLTATDAAAARTALEIQAGASDTERRNMWLVEIYLSKIFGVFRRAINLFATGFKGSDDDDYGIETADSSNYAVTAGTAGAITGYVAPTRTTLSRLTGGTPTMPKGGTAANINDNNPATIGVTGSSIGNMTGQSIATRIIAQIDYGANKTIAKIEAIGFHDNGSGTNTGHQLVYSTDGTNWTQLGASLSTNQTPQNYSSTGSVTARYIALAVSAQSWGAITLEIGDLNGYEAVPDDMTVVTAYQTADASVSTARALIEFDNSNSPTLNTDLIAELTCDGGANWAAATLSSVTANSQDGRSVAETSDVACTAGTSFAARIKTDNAKDIKIYGVAVSAA
ncbi:discoidin domain-containing protein [Afipia sp. TerB]